MEDVINLIKIRNGCNKLFSMQDIIMVVNYLTGDLGIKIRRIHNKHNKYIMSLSLEDLDLIVDYEKIKTYQDPREANYLVIFCIVHELRHYMQLDTKEMTLYQGCFSYINSKSLFKNAFYARFHDYFPIEINANMVAFLYVMYIQRRLGANYYYNLFEDKLNRMLNEINSKELSDVFVSLFGSDYKDVLNDMDEYDLFINGLLIDEVRREEMLKRILL